MGILGHNMRYRNPRIFLLIVTLWISLAFEVRPPEQNDDALKILEAMSPAERIGQLFLVSFNGISFSEDDPIYDLVTERSISGVLISKDHDNISVSPDSITNLKALTSSLQEARYNASLTSEPLEAFERLSVADTYVPLFIAFEYDGGQQGTEAILEGLSPMTSNLAIGATWDEENAAASGELVGRELEALGINLLIGPSLDVLEDPQILGSGDLGVHTFGGDPYWVSVMGSAFIAGIHTGSGERIAVIASHFPGLGSSDRPSEEEIATVRKSLEELKQFDLAPFFAVTQTDDENSTPLVQGLLTSHIRYQGFQGNIRATTRPVSMDPQAFELVMSLEPLNTWRLQGGITVSDSLGSRAIRLFRDPSGQTFNAHLVARDAFLAGNDLLLLDNFRDSNDPDEYTTIIATLDFFRNKYNEDPLFAQKVDQAALRIIRLKLKLFGRAFTRNNVFRSQNEIESIGNDRQIASNVAQNSATLISPETSQIEDRVGGIPRIGERIVFLTDIRKVKQCGGCSSMPLIKVDALESAVLRFYGPGAAGQVGGWNLRSYSFADLANYLGEKPVEQLSSVLAAEDEVDEAIRYADWLVFNMMDSRSSNFGANALQLFLDQRPDLAREKKVVVFSYDVPYGLDATEISKVDLYYALYDSGPSFIDMAAKLLFLEQSAPGASPVNIPGIGYELIEVTSPDPNQVIQLRLKSLEEGEEPLQEPQGFMIGDSVTIQTGVIVDQNGNHVPDRTPVEFQITSTTEGVAPEIINAPTKRGVAIATIPLERAGLLIITAQTGQARVSETLQLDAQIDVPAQATVISPTPIPTVTSEPTQAPELPTPTPEVGDESLGTIRGSFSSRLGALVLGLLATGIASTVGYYTANRNREIRGEVLRYTLLPAIAALMAYNYLALGLPGSLTFTTGLGGVGVFAVVLIAGAIGLLLAFLWSRMTTQ
jgi:beta-N-acetylhexosaminidase